MEKPFLTLLSHRGNRLYRMLSDFDVFPIPIFIIHPIRFEIVFWIFSKELVDWHSSLNYEPRNSIISYSFGRTINHLGRGPVEIACWRDIDQKAFSDDEVMRAEMYFVYFRTRGEIHTHTLKSSFCLTRLASPAEKCHYPIIDFSPRHLIHQLSALTHCCDLLRNGIAKWKMRRAKTRSGWLVCVWL